METPSAPTAIRIGRFRRLPKRETHTWQGGIVRMPMWVDSPSGGPPFRPWAAIWVTKPDGLVNMQLAESQERPGPDVAVRAIVDLALRHQDQLMGRPGRIHVIDAELGHAIAAALGDPTVVVEVVPELTDVTRVLHDLAEGASERTGVPGLLAAAGVTDDDVRALAEATDRFVRAEPWQYLSNEDLIGVDVPGLDRRAKFATVMGNAGLQRGVAFFASPGDVDRFVNSIVSGRSSKTYWAVMFSRADEIPMSDLEIWERLDLAVADPEAYPCPVGYTPAGNPVRPPVKLLRQMTEVLGALAESTEAQIDTGRWTVRVRSGAGEPVSVTLSLPDLLDVEPPTARASGHGTDRRATASTPLERAQDVVYEAYDAVGRRRVKLAREALVISPDCADAYVVLAEAAAGPERALAFYEAGVEAGARAIGAERFAAIAGGFWGALETRPYMRARLGDTNGGNVRAPSGGQDVCQVRCSRTDCSFRWCDLVAGLRVPDGASRGLGLAGVLEIHVPARDHCGWDARLRRTHTASVATGIDADDRAGVGCRVHREILQHVAPGPRALWRIVTSGHRGGESRRLAPAPLDARRPAMSPSTAPSTHWSVDGRSAAAHR